MIYILDRFENGLAVLINKSGSSLIVPRGTLGDAGCGDVFVMKDGRLYSDESAAEKRQSELKRRFDKLTKKL